MQRLSKGLCISYGWVKGTNKKREASCNHPSESMRVIDSGKGHLMEIMAFGRKSQLLPHYSPPERGSGESLIAGHYPHWLNLTRSQMVGSLWKQSMEIASQGRAWDRDPESGLRQMGNVHQIPFPSPRMHTLWCILHTAARVMCSF